MMYRDPIWPDVVVIVDVIGGLLLAAWLVAMAVVA